MPEVSMTFNRFRKVISAIGLVLLCTLSAACQGIEKNTTNHLTRVQAYYEKGKYDSALIEFKNAAQTDPESAEAYYKSGHGGTQTKEYQGRFSKLYTGRKT